MTTTITTTKHGLKILIVGAGLGGLSAAVRLAQDGHDVQLVEKSKALSTASGAIFIRSNAVRCLYRWQLGDAVTAVTTPIQNYQTRSGANNEILDFLPAAGLSDYPELSTDRQVLQNLLYNHACEAGARITFGKEIINIVEDSKGAHATAKDGTEYSVDLLLAADGISSRLRSTVLLTQHPPSSSSLAPILAPSTHYPAEIPIETLLSNETTEAIAADPDSDDAIMWACQGGYVVGKCNRRRRLFNVTFSIQHGLGDDDHVNNPRLFDDVGDLDAVRSYFSHYHPILRTLTEMIDSCSRWRLARLEPLDRWSSNERRLVLLGDSAHAMLPNLAQGYSSIVEDVEALSVLLEEGGGTTEVADIIELWEKVRIPRVRKLQQGSLWNYELYNAGKAPGDELTEEQKHMSMGQGDGNAPFNTLPFLKWTHDYDVYKEVKNTLENI